MGMIGIIGGSGLYELFSDAEKRYVETRYGTPSSPISIGDVNGKEVAFMTRHGGGHSVPPHLINYRANVMAMHEIGVDTLIISSTVGSLRADYKPGDFVLPDQLYDRTSGRPGTFYEGPKVVHISMADPFCGQLRKTALEVFDDLGQPVHDGGTSVVIQGPRFSTRAESKTFQKLGFSVLSMTNMPETTLARELGMCVLNLSFVSDLDAGVPGIQDEPVTAGMVWRRVQDAQPRLREILFGIVGKAMPNDDCECRSVLKDI